MANICETVARRHRSQIQEIARVQREENREAIFFIYSDNSTSDIFIGDPTRIELTDEEQARILNDGEIKMSVHTHPSKFDPSTIDLMTGILTRQERVCVAVPIRDRDIDDDFVLTCLDISNLNISEKRRLFRGMRRSSIAVSRAGHETRKQFNLQRFPVTGCRTHDIDIEGIKFLQFSIGRITGVSERSEN